MRQRLCGALLNNQGTVPFLKLWHGGARCATHRRILTRLDLCEGGPHYDRRGACPFRKNFSHLSFVHVG